ncbi:TPA: HPr family phosphocarrier protein [Klebsiella pneumoniae]|nr:HPr family phosphocarrier protein [Klebsiella pneumoniae]
MKKVIAVTGCPTGIAHTFMAEEALKTAAKKLSVEIKVETNGASGVENAITPDDLQDIYGVIIAADKDVNAERFNGLPVIEVPVKDGIHHPDELITKVIQGNAPIRKGSVKASTSSGKVQAEQESFGRQLYKHLMSGVSNMLPFVVAGGILIAISFLWGIYSANPESPEYNIIAATLMKIGQQAFSIMVPVFTAYIAYSIAGRPGMVAGFVGGLLANVTGAGFLGGIIAGFAAGYFMLWVRNLLGGLPRQYEGLKSIFIMPLIGVLVIGVMMILLGQPVAALNNGMMHWLSSLQEANPILLGIVVGAMCSFDFGGPVNKAAYVTGTLLLGQGNYFFMAGVSAACITPPLVIALATTFFPKGFTEEERTAGMVNYILGCTHITEGAIPFAAKDPLRVIPLMMIASSVSAVLSYSMHIQVPAPHGGFLILPLVSKPFIWVLCILAGSVCGAVMLGALRLWQRGNQTIPVIPEPVQSVPAEKNAINLRAGDIFFNRDVSVKDDALMQVAKAMEDAKLISSDYLTGMRDREAQISTYLGNGIAIPHGTPQSRHAVLKTGVKVMVCPQGIDWGEGQTARLIVAIAAQDNEHLDILRRLTHVLSHDGVQEALEAASDAHDVLNILEGKIPDSHPQDKTEQISQYDAEGTFTLINAHGLHARPSALLVKTIKQWQSDIRLENLDTQSDVVDGKNLMKVVSLGAKQGHRLHVMAKGPDAHEAIKSISAAFDSGLGEGNGSEPHSPEVRVHQ